MTTLETVVPQRLKEFDALRDEYPALLKRVEELQATLDACDRNTAPEAYFKAHDALTQATVECDKARRAEESKIEYLLNTTPYIRDYLNSEVVEKDESTPSGPKSTLDDFVEVTGETRRKDVFYKYLVHVEGNTDITVISEKPASSYSDETCVCGAKCFFDSRESMLVCETCGITKSHSYHSTRNLSYTEEISMNAVSSYSYKRSNHLQEHLSTLQGKQNTEIPDEVIDAVRAEFRKQRIRTRGEISPPRVRAFLKKLGFSKYYEHTNYITAMLNGVPPPQLSAELEQKLKSMFLQIQAPFQKHCPPTRTNFLSYTYVLHMLCKLLGADEYLPYFPLLKCQQKLFACEKIWKAICKDLSWEFIPSL
jgi:hypothetical protein